MRLHVNGVTREVDRLSPTTTLLRYLRDELGLAGTKEGCAEGDCGACTVAVADQQTDGTPTFRAVNACLVLLPMMQGRQVFTVESLKGPEGHHPAQRELAARMGSQCGYCTPGVTMALFEASHRDDLKEPWQIDDQMCGNLCRCTGYRPIREAAEAVAGCARSDRLSPALERPRESMQLAYERAHQRYFNPVSLVELFEVLERHPGARFVSGGTALSPEVTKRFQEPPLLVSVEGVPELRSIAREGRGWRIGAAVTLTELQERLAGSVLALEKMIRFFASRQIKNRATVGGNICTASPIGDLPPVLIALGATVTLASRSGRRTMLLEEFFLSYRKTALAEGELLESVFLPDLQGDAIASSFKVSKRRELDISAVSAGLFVRVDAGRGIEARLAYGGVAATPARARATEAALVGQQWTEAVVREAMGHIDADFKPLTDHRGSAWYRAKVAKNLLLGFFLESQHGLDTLEQRPTATVHLGVR